MSVSEAVYDKHDPAREVSAENPWYMASQFEVHFGNPAYKVGVERRWKLFEDLIGNWFEKNPDRAQTCTILDAGCGDGINLMGLGRVAAENKWTLQILGLDYNKLRLDRATSLSDVTGLCQGSALTLPYCDDSIDVALCSQVLEHIGDASGALSELRRVVKPDGLLILGVPNEGCLLARLRNRVLQPSIQRKTDHVNFYTTKRFGQTLRKAGLEIHHLEREGFFFPHLRLHVYLGGRTWGRSIAASLLRLFPSQTAGLIVACSAKNST